MSEQERLGSIEFPLYRDQVWVDPEGVAWYLRFVDGDVAHLERVAVCQRDALDLVRTWHTPGDQPRVEEL